MFQKEQGEKPDCNRVGGNMKKKDQKRKKKVTRRTSPEVLKELECQGEGTRRHTASAREEDPDTLVLRSGRETKGKI